ncbi:MAG: CvpA family protein [Planctomycetota bacterium]|jgi:uncharacterized membrane protein required for colicin V production
MVFWIAILIGGIFLWFALKLGFYETWIMLFNIVISIYIALFLKPVITEHLPPIGDIRYCCALTIVVTAVATFLIFQGLAYVFLTSQFNITFPKVFEVLGSGLLGFLAGFLVCSFVAMNIALTPVPKMTPVENLGFDLQSQQDNISYLCWWSDLVHKVVAHKDNQYTTKQLIEEIAEETKKDRPKPAKPTPKAPPEEPSTPERTDTNLPEQ